MRGVEPMRLTVTWTGWTSSNTVTAESGDDPVELDHTFFADDPRITGRSGNPLSIEWVGDTWQVHNHSRTHGLWVRMPYPAANVEPYDIWPLVDPVTELWPAARGQASEFALTARVDPPPSGLGDPRRRAFRSADIQGTEPTVDPFTGSDPGRLVDQLDPFHAHELSLPAAKRIYAATFQAFFFPGPPFRTGQPPRREVVSAKIVAESLGYRSANSVNRAFEGRYAWFLRNGDPRPEEQDKAWFLGNLLRHGLLGLDDVRRVKAEL